MNHSAIIETLLLLVLAGCTTVTVDRDSEARARSHIRLADSLESVSAFPEAALEYGIVAELYPHTSFYPTALRQAAFLHLHPDNGSANDSTALYWFKEYLRASSPSPERRSVEVCIHLLERIWTLRGSLARIKTANDSLTTVTRKQASEMVNLASQLRQAQSLEAELKKVHEELQKLREVDIRISKGREKK
jgi:hypothetical protein